MFVAERREVVFSCETGRNVQYCDQPCVTVWR
jgi:hypothetical protein